MKRLFGLALCLVLIMPIRVFAGTETCSDGVLIGGIDVGGMSKAQITEAVKGKIAQLGAQNVTVRIGDETTSVSLSALGLKWANTEILDEAMELGTTGNIVQRYKDQKDLQNSNRSFDLSFCLDEKKTLQFAQECESFNTEPVDARIYTTDDLTPGVDGGTDGITVDVEKSAKVLMEAGKNWDGSSALEVEFTVDRVKPDITYEDLSVIKDVLGSATTDYSASSYGRAVNVENGCYKISGTLLYPGDYFSVTDAVTPFTPENGYELAPSYEENQVVNSYGGGICQVSTTLYNAVLKSELEVVSRSNHTMAVSYVDLSKDAAIAEGSMDMAFVNNLEDPIYIIGYAYGGTINFTIYGRETRDPARSIQFESRTLATVEPSGTKLAANPAQAVGYVNQTQSPHTGYSAELWKNIYYNGEWVDSVHINSSYYNAVGTVYDIGVATTNAALSQAMYAAIATGDISQVYAVINGQYQTQTETTAPETTAPTPAAPEPAAPAEPEYVEPEPVYVEPEPVIIDTPDGEVYVEQ